MISLPCGKRHLLDINPGPAVSPANGRTRKKYNNKTLQSKEFPLKMSLFIDVLVLIIHVHNPKIIASKDHDADEQRDYQNTNTRYPPPNEGKGR